MKIVVFIDHFASGGAARVTSVMLEVLCRQHEVVLALDNQNHPIFYPVPATVRVESTYVPRRGRSHIAGLCLLAERVLKYRKIIVAEQPDVIIGVEPEPFLYARLATCMRKIRVIAVDHTNFHRKQHWFTHWIRFYAYAWADAVSILSQADAKILGGRLPNKTVVYNPLPYTILEGETDRKTQILCVGRLDLYNVKGLDRMISMWGKVASHYPSWKLVIAGNYNAESAAYLNHLAAKAGLPAEQLQYLGQVEDMQALYQESAIFALPSRTEGFPMCLLEAASQGCACIGFSQQGVLYEMLTPSSGLIIADNDEASFLEGLCKLLESDSLRYRLGQNVRSDMQRFSREVFAEEWNKILTNR